MSEDKLNPNYVSVSMELHILDKDGYRVETNEVPVQRNVPITFVDEKGKECKVIIDDKGKVKRL